MNESRFENNQIFVDDLPNFENVEMQSISRDYLKVKMINAGILSAFFISITIAVFFIWQEIFYEYSIYIFSTLFLLVAFVVVYHYFSFFTIKYAFREKDVVCQKGLFLKTIELLPLSRIQHIDLEEGWISRSYGLKSLVFYTAGSISEIRIAGLPKDVAEQFNQFVLQKINEETMDNALLEDEISENKLRENQDGPTE